MSEKAELWKATIRQLLKHFDDTEGTTYLYSATNRAEFVKQADPAIREELKTLLDGYHGD